MAEQLTPEASAIRRVGLIGVLALAAALIAASPAGAANTIEGSCSLSGVFKFEPPLGNEPRETSFRDYASGTCTGTLNGVPQVNAPVVIRGRGSGTLSCLGPGRATNFAKLIFTRGTKSDADDVKIDFVAETVGGLLEFVAVVRGAVSGSGTGHANFLPYADESDFAACEAGTLESARYDLLARTITPIVG
jgi:hypothetical protein